MMKTFPYFANFSVCLSLVLSNRIVKKRSMNFKCFLKSVTIGSRSLSIKNAGIRFPSVPIMNAWIGPSPRLIPSGIPSLSSSPGSIELKKVISSVVGGVGSMWVL